MAVKKIASHAALLVLLAQAAAAPAGTAAVGMFTKNLTGVSVFTEQGKSINVQGRYAGLKPRTAYFTVVYANATCDPAQAFPIGPFTTTKNGNGQINQSNANPTGIDVAETKSISVRYGDVDLKTGQPTDQDADGNTGAADVVAVPGKPSVGLLECDTNPFTN